MQVLAASIRYDKTNPVASIAVCLLLCLLRAITGATVGEKFDLRDLSAKNDE